MDFNSSKMLDLVRSIPNFEKKYQMSSFDDLLLNKPLRNALDELEFDKPTPIQERSFPVVRSGSDVVGIAQTGTGKTLAYMLPILQDIKFAKLDTPRVLILVPTRELVLQVVDRIEAFAKYINLRILGVYGGTNINTQKKACGHGHCLLEKCRIVSVYIQNKRLF